MAPSRRSPSLRDRRREEDDQPASRHRRHDDDSPRRRRASPTTSARRSEVDTRRNLRAEASPERRSQHATQDRRERDRALSRRREAQDFDRSPRRGAREEEPRRRREVTHDRIGKEREQRRLPDEEPDRKRKRRSPSPPPRLDSHKPRRERRRSRSPEPSHFDRSRSPIDSYRGRGHSPGRVKRDDLFSTSAPVIDSYVPPARRRSQSPGRRRETHRRRSSSRDRSHKRHSRSPPPRKRARSPAPLRGGDTFDRSGRESVRRAHSRAGSPKGAYRRDRSVASHNSRQGKESRRPRSRSKDGDLFGKDYLTKKKMQSGMPHGSRRTSPHHSVAGGHAQEQYGFHGPPPRQVRPPHIDTRSQQQHYTTPNQWTPTSSHHGSPHAASPYSQGGRGGWPQQQQQYHGQHTAFSPPYRQNNYPPQQSPPAAYYGGQHSPYNAGPMAHQTPYHGQSQRGGNAGYRGNQSNSGSDRRYSGGNPPPAAGSHPTATRGRGGHFQNLQWTASSAKQAQPLANQTNADLPSASDSDFRAQIDDEEEDNPFRPSKELRVDEEEEKPSAKEASKISFALKAKTTSLPPKPQADLLHVSKDLPKKNNLLESSRAPTSFKQPDKYDSRRERDDRRPRDDTRDYRRSDYRDERWSGRDSRPEKPPARNPEPKLMKRILKRPKPRRQLEPDLAASKSVYYRKPGNESVVGSGTYGKVFKALHVYTKKLVALKKIRMDGEKDGFPVTAVREIKLLQSLRHDNIVSLQEVMVENNDCFMVFEYLSHDLVGLLNHPVFKLEHAHRKDLSRQLFEGLNYLHRRGVLHRDIKAANILVSNEGQLKLADFGLARFYSKRGKLDYTNRVVTIWYRSPELLLGETQYGPAVDIWSAACVMVEVFTRHAIFPGDGGEINQLDKIYNVLGTPTRAEWPGLVDMAWYELLRPTERKTNTFAEKYQERIPASAFELLQAMFAYDPNNRPTASDVLEHPYFATEEPAPRQAVELKEIQGDWHEFESKAHRKENERKQQEARRAARSEEHEREKAKRRASAQVSSEREAKRLRLDPGQEGGAVSEVK